jgi:6-phosphogluconolactonase (cycloisomerase 2 family)
MLKIDRASGSLTEVLPRTTTAGLAPSAMVMDAAGSSIFVVEQGTPDVSVYSVGSDGTLQVASTVLLGSLPSNVALADSGSLLFVALPNASAVDVFSVSSGTLNRVGGAPFRVPNGVASVSLDHNTSFLYAAGFATDTISGFSISPAGVLTELPTSPYGSTTLKTPVATFIDPTGTHLYAANFGAAALSEFTISSTGDLTAVTTGAPSAGTNPSFFALDARATFVYVANSGSNSLTQLKINSDGTLTSSNTIQVGAVPRGVAFTK